MHRSLLFLMPALAGPALAAPLEAPLRDQSAVLHYEIEVRGQAAGAPLLQRLIAEIPMVAKESDAFHPLARDFTAGQNAEIAARSAGDMSAGDPTTDMLEVSRLITAMEGVCGEGDSPACALARTRYQAAERRLADRSAIVEQAQAPIARGDEDDHRFLTFATGPGGCGSVRYEQQLGDRRVEGVYPSAGAPEASLAACMSMAVLDRRNGSISLQMSPATLRVEAGRIVDLAPLQGAKDLQFGALRMSLTTPMLPTAGPEGDYAGSHSVKAGALTYTFRWTLTPT